MIALVGKQRYLKMHRFRCMVDAALHDGNTHEQQWLSAIKQYGSSDPTPCAPAKAGGILNLHCLATLRQEGVINAVFDWDLRLDPEMTAVNDTRIRILQFVRNPIEMVASAYAYHKTDKLEGWLRQPYTLRLCVCACHSNHATNSSEKRDAGIDCTRYRDLLLNTTRPSPETCTAISGALAADDRIRGYQDLLRRLTPRHGVLLEAWHSLWPIAAQHQSMAAVASQPPGIALTLDIASAHKQATAISSFLGLPDTCERRVGMMVMHKSHRTSTSSTAVQERADVTRVLQQDLWAVEYIAPYTRDWLTHFQQRSKAAA